jgi:hypothetical protein
VLISGGGNDSASGELDSTMFSFALKRELLERRRLAKNRFNLNRIFGILKIAWRKNEGI